MIEKLRSNLRVRQRNLLYLIACGFLWIYHDKLTAASPATLTRTFLLHIRDWAIIGEASFIICIFFHNRCKVFNYALLTFTPSLAWWQIVDIDLICTGEAKFDEPSQLLYVVEQGSRSILAQVTAHLLEYLLNLDLFAVQLNWVLDGFFDYTSRHLKWFLNVKFFETKLDAVFYIALKHLAHRLNHVFIRYCISRFVSRQFT